MNPPTPSYHGGTSNTGLAKYSIRPALTSPVTVLSAGMLVAADFLRLCGDSAPRPYVRVADLPKRRHALRLPSCTIPLVPRPERVMTLQSRRKRYNLASPLAHRRRDNLRNTP